MKFLRSISLESNENQLELKNLSTAQETQTNNNNITLASYLPYQKIKNKSENNVSTQPTLNTSSSKTNENDSVVTPISSIANDLKNDLLDKPTFKIDNIFSDEIINSTEVNLTKEISNNDFFSLNSLNNGMDDLSPSCLLPRLSMSSASSQQIEQPSLISPIKKPIGAERNTVIKGSISPNGLTNHSITNGLTNPSQPNILDDNLLPQPIQKQTIRVQPQQKLNQPSSAPSSPPPVSLTPNSCSFTNIDQQARLKQTQQAQLLLLQQQQQQQLQQQQTFLNNLLLYLSNNTGNIDQQQMSNLFMMINQMFNQINQTNNNISNFSGLSMQQQQQLLIQNQKANDSSMSIIKNAIQQQINLQNSFANDQFGTNMNDLNSGINMIGNNNQVI